MARTDSFLRVETSSPPAVDRRLVLKAGVLGGALLAADALFARRAAAAPPYGALGPADANGLQLPNRFTSRIVARSNVKVTGTSYKWHRAPDGGRVFADPNGDGWAYVSNAELADGAGGASMIRFAGSGAIIGAGRILSGTNRNCAGGHTPWGTWLSCEEVTNGRVWEVDPFGLTSGLPAARLAMGRFNHEGAAVDAANQTVYMTEDAVSGLFYRYRYGAPYTWTNGLLEAAQVENGFVTRWIQIPDPSGSTTPTRKQAAGATKFNGGEGIWFEAPFVNFTTKGDDRVWAYHVGTGQMRVVYDWQTAANPVLRGVDNIAVLGGLVFVCEDQSTLDVAERTDPEICMIEPSGQVSTVLRAVGHRQSELTGVAFNPAGNRMYFSSQRGTTGTVGGGTTFEVSGPF